MRAGKRNLMLSAVGIVVAAGQANGQERTVLPIPAAPFDGVIAESILDARPATPRPVRAPDGAPNVLLFMADDVGFAMSSTFGGPVPTPNMNRLAASGQRYNRVHTTGICSPTRAALLTGRNHHNTGVGHLSDTPVGFPGYTGRISPETATIAQVLRLNGYNTAMFGKHHNVPGGEETAAGPFDSWPTGLGFEYFFGIIAGDSDQFDPNLVRGTSRVDPDEGQGRMLERRLADEIINWVHNQKAAAPDKPFFVYYAPGSTHAPHQAPPEVIAHFRGKFDQGWDKVREETHRRQLSSGVIPRGTRLTPRPAELPAWDSLDSNQRDFAVRAMEVAAAQLAYQDEQLGRVIDELERMGQLGNTLVAIIQGDNGASAEAGPAGTINELQHINGLHESPKWLAANVEKLGGPKTYQSYPAGWAWAMNTPLRWTKQYGSMLGGTRNGMILSWKGKVRQPGSICAEFGHVIDVAPTVLAAAGLPAPRSVYGVVQKPMDGLSLLPSLAACQPDRPRTQYFELGGKLGLYHNGWFASRDTGRLPWQAVAAEGPRAARAWDLYDLSSDFSQSTNLAGRFPDRTEELAALWHREAERNNVFPLEPRFGRARSMSPLPLSRKYEYWGIGTSISATRNPVWAGRSFTLDAQLRPAKPDASGVVMAVGSHFGGFSLFLDRGKPTFVYARSTAPNHIYRIVTERSLPSGMARLRLRFVSEGPNKAARATILADNTELASGVVGETFLMPSGLTETLDIGRDLGVTVTDYPSPRGRFEGEIPYVSVTFDR